VAMGVGVLVAVGMGNSVTTPAVVMRPILLLFCSMNQRAPSGPTVIACGKLPAVGTGNCVMAPAVVIRPIWSLRPSVNQNAPSGPSVIPSGALQPGRGGSSAVGRASA